jgi:hypothetical protein
VTFEEAARWFGERLEAAGWPGEIVWARQSEVQRGPGQDVIVYVGLEDERLFHAARAFEAARAAGRGAAFTAVCTLGDSTCAIVGEAAAGAPEAIIPAAPVAGSARWPVC